MAAVQLEGISKRHPNGVEVVRDFNLSVENGEFMVLVGPSGCGKSTLLNMIAGLDEPSSGRIMIGGRVVNDLPPKSRDIAMVFQNYALYPHMTVFGNMAFGLKLRRHSKAEINNRVAEAATLLGIDRYLKRLPRELSGGQRQRVAVGRAIVRHASVFLFDEPLSNLDAKLRVQMRVEIKELHKKLRATMIYVTHDQTEAMTLGDRIAVLRDGALQQVSSPLSVYDTPANRFVASFIGTPPMNFLEGTLVTNATGPSFRLKNGPVLTLPTRFSGLKEMRAGQPVIMGIRPEGIGSARALHEAASTRIKGEIRVIEPLGSESYVHLGIGEANLVAKVEGRDLGGPGTSVDLPVMDDKIFFFDHVSGEALNT